MIKQQDSEIKKNRTDQMTMSEDNNDGYKATFCSPKYQTASLVGCVISMLQ